MITLAQVYKLIEKAADIEVTDLGITQSYMLHFDSGLIKINHMTYVGGPSLGISCIDTINGSLFYSNDDIDVVDKIVGRINYRLENMEAEIQASKLEDTVKRIDAILN